MASRERSVSELIKAARGDTDRRKKYPFEYWDRYDFNKYCRRFKMKNRGPKARKWRHWFVVYAHYRRFKSKQPKKFRFILPPRTFLEMMRFFFRSVDKKRLRFCITHKAPLGLYNVKKAYKASALYRKKAVQPKSEEE